MNSEHKLGIERELEIMQKSNHPFVIKYYEHFIYKEKICILTEYASGGNLEKYVEKKFPLTED